MAYIADNEDELKKDDQGAPLQVSTGASGTITGGDASASSQTATNQPVGAAAPTQAAGQGGSEAGGSQGGTTYNSTSNDSQPKVDAPKPIPQAEGTVSNVPKGLQQGAASDNVANAPLKSPPPSVTPQNRKQSGSFTNIQKYLQGNQGAGIANQVAGNIEDQFDSARQNLKTGAQGLAQKALDNGVDISPDFIQAGINNAGATDATQKALADQFATYKQNVDAGYQGPKTLDEMGNLSDIKSQYADAAAQANLTNSEAGRFALIDKMFGNPTYTQGSKRLDQLLLQNDPAARARFEALNTLSGQAQQDVGNASNQFAALSGNEANRYTSAQNAIQRALRGESYDLKDVPQELSFDGLKGVAGNTAPMLQAYNQKLGQEATAAGTKADVAKLQNSLAGTPINKEVDYSAPASAANPKAYNPIYALTFSGATPQQAQALMLTPLATKMSQVQNLIANRTFNVEAPKNVPVDPVTGLPSLESYANVPGGIGSAVIKDDKGNPVATVADLLYKKVQDMTTQLDQDTGDQMRSVNMALFSGTIDPTKDPKTWAIIFGRQPTTSDRITTIPQEYRQALINAVSRNEVGFSDALTPEMKSKYIALAGLIGLKPEDQKIKSDTAANAETAQQNVGFNQGQASNIIAGVNLQKSNQVKSKVGSIVDTVLNTPVQNHGAHQPIAHELDVNESRYSGLINQPEPPWSPFGGFSAGPGYLSLATEVANKTNDAINNAINALKASGYTTSYANTTGVDGEIYNVRNELIQRYRSQGMSQNDINNRLSNGNVKSWIQSKAVARVLDHSTTNFRVLGDVRKNPNIFQGQNENMFQQINRQFT